MCKIGEGCVGDRGGVCEGGDRRAVCRAERTVFWGEVFILTSILYCLSSCFLFLRRVGNFFSALPMATTTPRYAQAAIR